MNDVNQKDLIELMSRFDAVRVVVVGDVILDEYIKGTVARISPEAPIPVVDVRSESWVPGGAANVAANLRALGVMAELVGVVGDDTAGRTIVSEMRRQGIGTLGVLAGPNRATTRKTRIIAAHQQVVRVNREVRIPIDGPTSARLLDAAYRLLQKCDALVLEDYGKGVLTEQICAGLIGKTRELGKPVICDPKEGRFQMYRGVTLITPNLREAAAAAGMELRNDDESVRLIADRLKQMLECDMVLVTRGEEGMSLMKDENYFCTLPTVAQEVFDVSGAGDTVVAAIAAGIGAGAQPEEACALANYAAGCVVAKLGTATVTREEVRRALEARP